MSIDIEKRKQCRLKFMLKLYEATGGYRHGIVNMWELGKDSGLSREDTEVTVEYLVGEGLAEYVAMGGTIGITHYGILEVERAVDEPEEPTRYFPAAVNFISIGQMHDSAIQQGTVASGLSYAPSSQDVLALHDAVNELRKRLDDLGIGEENRAVIEADIDTIDAQLRSGRPKPPILSECLKSIREVLEGTATNVAAELLHKFIDL